MSWKRKPYVELPKHLRNRRDNKMYKDQKAFEYLEGLQESIYMKLGAWAEREMNTAKAYETNSTFFSWFIDKFIDSQLRDLSSEERAKERERIICELKKDLESTPTRFENPGYYKLLVAFSEQIEKAAKDLSIPVPSHLVFGTLPTGRVNAMAVLIPNNGGYLVLFESQIFTFANLFSKVVASALPLKSDSSKENYLFSIADEDWKENIRNNPDVLRRFFEVITAYLLLGRPIDAPAYLPEPHIGSLAGVLRNSMELFIMAHEYGHIISDHFASSENKLYYLHEYEVTEINQSWHQEFEADAMGIQLMIQAMIKDGYDISLSFWGSDFFFSCMEIVDRFLCLFKGIDIERLYTPGSTHPPPTLRREFLRKFLRKSILDDTSKEAIKLGITLQKIVEHLWQLTESRLREMKKDGQKLAPIWQ